MGNKSYYRICGVKYKRNSFKIREEGGKTYLNKVNFKIYVPGDFEVIGKTIEPDTKIYKITIDVRFGYANQTRDEIFDQKSQSAPIIFDLSKKRFESNKSIEVIINWISLMDGPLKRPETSGGSILVGT